MRKFAKIKIYLRRQSGSRSRLVVVIVAFYSRLSGAGFSLSHCAENDIRGEKKLRKDVQKKNTNVSANNKKQY